MSNSGDGTREDRWSDPRGNSAPIAWTGQAGSSRFDHWFGSRRHDVSVIAVWHLGLGNKTAILTIRPWWQTGHSRKEEPVSSS